MVSAAPALEGVLALHLQLQAFKGGIDPLFQFAGVQAANRVLHHDKVWFQLARPGLRQHKRPERLGGDHHPDQPAFP
jgi:hypothetical protein